MRMLDLFSGIGGFSLAASWVWGDDLEIVGFCEQDKFCQAVLKKHWPAVPIFDDIRELTHDALADTTSKRSYQRNPGSNLGSGITEDFIQSGSGWASKTRGSDRSDSERGCADYETTLKPVDLVTGGFPCQPYSVAGKQRGSEDDRALWPEMLRVIQEVRPRWVIGENVGGFVNMGLDESLSDLEAKGYECEAVIIPACAKNAPHRRDRVWIVGFSQKHHNRREPRAMGDKKAETRKQNDGAKFICSDRHASDTSGDGSATRVPGSIEGEKGNSRIFDDSGYQGFEWSSDIIEAATALCGMDDGIPGRVDRLKSLGNAIVPQIAAEIMQAIKDTEI